LANHFKSIIRDKYKDVNVDEPRLTMRLLKEAAKTKEILSANQVAQTVVCLPCIACDGGLSFFSPTVTRTWRSR
jgi:molecular chaperone DnaK (HSP70)